MKNTHKHTPAYIALTIAVVILFLIALLTCCHASGEPAYTTEPTVTMVTDPTGDISMASKPTVAPTVPQNTEDPIVPSTEPAAPTEASDGDNGSNKENTSNNGNTGNSGNTGNNGNSGTTTPTSPIHITPSEPTPAVPIEPTPTEPKPTEPAPTTPAPTEPKPTEPAPTEPKPTEPAPTEPKPTEPAPTEPTPTEPEPTEHVHNWVKTTHPATGHTEGGIKCKCGWTIYVSESKHGGDLALDFKDHIANYNGDEKVLNHTSYSSIERFVVDTPAYDTWVCSECGEERTTEP